MNKYKWILVVVAVILTATLVYKCNDGEEKFVTKESTEFVKVEDSLNNIISVQEGYIDSLLAKVKASEKRTNK